MLIKINVASDQDIQKMNTDKTYFEPWHFFTSFKLNVFTKRLGQFVRLNNKALPS